MKFGSVIAGALAMTLWGAPSWAQGICVGDCDGAGSVTVDEILIGVNIALGERDVVDCVRFDSNDDGTVTVDELLTAVNNALTGCQLEVAKLVAHRVAAGPAGLDDPIWDGITAFTPTLSDMSTGLLYGDGQLNMSGTFDGVVDFNGGEPADLSLKATHDGTSLYILAEWTDREFNLDRRRWLFNGPSDSLKPGESAAEWTSQLNDDKIGFAFEIESASSIFGSFDAVGCASSCHNVAAQGEPLALDMRPGAGKVDIWHWKTSRSEPLGYVQDQVSDPTNGRVGDSGTGIEHRNRPSGGTDRSGPDTEWDGTVQEFTRWDGETVTLDPAYILLDGHRTGFAGDPTAGQTIYAASCAGCHGASGQGGLASALTPVKNTRLSRELLASIIADPDHAGASSFNPLSETEKTDLLARMRGFSGVPGYYLTPPSGSVADIVTLSNVDYGRVDSIQRTGYRVLMIRDLATGNDDDAEFAPGNEYLFGVGLMDNDGKNHIGSRREVMSLDP